MKMTFLLSFLIVIILLAGCNKEDITVSPFLDVDTIDGIWIEAIPVTVTPEGLTIALCNTTERDDIVYSYGFCVEEKDGENWYPLFRPSMVSEGPAIALNFPTASQIKAGEPNEEEYWWKSYCGALEPGEYRLVIAVSSMDEGSNSMDYFLTAPFEIK